METRQRRPAAAAGGEGSPTRRSRAPAPPPRRAGGAGRAMPLLAALAVALLALRLGVRVVTLLRQRGAGGSGSDGGGGVGQQQALFTREQLAAATGGGGSPMLLSILGEVFDVSSKPEYYGKGSTYHHFVAADGSRAFVTGEFESAPREDIEDLSPEEINTIVGWRRFYHDTYPYKGRLIGSYYDAAGAPTPLLARIEAKAEEGARLKEEKEKEVKQYTACSVGYTQAEGGRVWCEEGQYPRKLFSGMDQGAASWRCVCIGDIGWSDLLQVYPDCAPDASSCATSPPAA